MGSNSWDVHFDNIQVNENSVSTTSPASIIDDTEIDFAVNLDKPGDYYNFTVDIVNEGTIDAMIESISLPEFESDAISFSAAYSNGTKINENDLLPAGSTYTIDISLEYTDSENLPEEDEDLTIDASLLEEKLYIN